MSKSKYFFGKNVDDSKWYLWGTKQALPAVLFFQYEPIYGPYKFMRKALAESIKEGVTVQILK